ncbi:hypothetical protein LAZ67_13000976 [Cordylochernes scorpioides]|uniref:CCHC-type domain-containing protein n=1 Tax=Cordylochernes scorpioides TaxID=51811 RepID=A0ABY6L644_9ARAC|nr:hypothetical protein LAZ67_13000976 [Cordylochernes scorpioides]
MKKEEKWEDYLYRAERVLEQARNLGADIEDEEFITSVLSGLPHKYNLIVLQLSNQENLTIFDLINSLKLYHERFSNDTKEENSSAFKVYSKDKYKHYKEMKTPKTYKCFICHKPGHKAAECWHNPENNKITNVKQTFASQGSSGYNANTPNKNSKSTFAKDENRNDFAKLVKQHDNLEQQWILDSGASSHMTFHLDHLKNIQAINKEITLADDSYITSESIGDVEIKNSDEESIILKDVLYVPKSSDNLISTSHQGYSIPNCYKEAMNLPDSEKWIGAMEKELDSLREHKVWTLQPLPKGSKVIKSKWIYTIKKDATTQDRKYKARLVATGYQQSYGKDYEDIFSPVIKNDSLRVILAFAAIMQYDIKCFDIVTAYLYGNLEETIYMKQPEEFENMPRRSRPLIGRNTAASRRYRNARAIETPLQSETRRALRRLRYSEARVAATQTMQVPVQRIQLWTHKPFSGIEENFSHKTNIGLFADDIILWSSNTNWKKSGRDLNKTLLHLEKFANKHKLEFNPQKSETCLFTTDKKLYKIRPNIILKEQQLQYNKHPKYLGYTLDPEINSTLQNLVENRQWVSSDTTHFAIYDEYVDRVFRRLGDGDGVVLETNLKDPGLQYHT